MSPGDESIAPASLAESTRKSSPGGRGDHARRWTIAIALAVGVHAAAFLLLRTTPIDEGVQESRSTVIEWLGPQAATSDTLIGEQLALFDNAPLFLPTPWNYAVIDARDLESRAPADIFPVYGHQFSFETERSPLEVLDMVRTVPSALEAARGFRWPYLSTFGRVDRDAVNLPARVAFVEVRSVETGEVVFSADVAPDRVPNAGDWPDWRPFNLVFDIDRFGTVGEPLVAPPGSQAEDVDAFFRQFVKSGLQLSLLLPPGYYNAIVGP